MSQPETPENDNPAADKKAKKPMSVEKELRIILRRKARSMGNSLLQEARKPEAQFNLSRFFSILARNPLLSVRDSEHSPRFSPLHYMVWNYNLPGFNALMDAKAPTGVVTLEGETPLALAAVSYDEEKAPLRREMARALIRANPQDIDYPDDYGRSPGMRAVAANDVLSARMFFIENAADITLRDKRGLGMKDLCHSPAMGAVLTKAADRHHDRLRNKHLERESLWTQTTRKIRM